MFSVLTLPESDVVAVAISLDGVELQLSADCETQPVCLVVAPKIQLVSVVRAIATKGVLSVISPTTAPPTGVWRSLHAVTVLVPLTVH